MARAPEWTKEEFEVLLQNPHLSPDELSTHLPNRSVDAVIVVRKGIHAFHTGGNISMLSKMMIGRLESETEGASCSVCGTSLS